MQGEVSIRGSRQVLGATLTPMARPVLGPGAVAVATRLGRLLAVIAVVAAGAVTAPHGLAASHEITIRDTGFDPSSLTVVAGEPVTWTNATASQHTVTAVDGSFDSGPIGPGEAFGHVFDTPGTFAYQDTLTPALAGTITVTPAPPTPVTSGPPAPTPPAGTLPPNFSPFPSVGPVATPTPEPTAAPSPTPATPAPAPSAAPGGGTPDAGSVISTVAVVVVVGGIATYLARVFVGPRTTSGPKGRLPR